MRSIAERQRLTDRPSVPVGGTRRDPLQLACYRLQFSLGARMLLYAEGQCAVGLTAPASHAMVGRRKRNRSANRQSLEPREKSSGHYRRKETTAG